MSTMSYKGYDARIEYDDDDAIFFGRLVGIDDGVGFHADTVADLRRAFHEAVDDYVETCRKAGKAPQKSFSGNVMLRLPSELHRAVAVAAELASKSLNQFGEEALLRALNPPAGVLAAASGRAGYEKTFAAIAAAAVVAEAAGEQYFTVDLADIGIAATDSAPDHFSRPGAVLLSKNVRYAGKSVSPAAPGSKGPAAKAAAAPTAKTTVRRTSATTASKHKA